jgi:hypothetical protein
MSAPVKSPAPNVVLVAMAIAACSSAQVPSSQCQRDDQCGGDQACVVGTCLPRAAPPTTWDIEVMPKSDSTAGFTELMNQAGPADAFDLAATPKVTVTGTLSFDAAAATLTAAHIVLKAPATIPGRPDLQYETDLSPVTAKMPTPTFTLSVPEKLLGRTGSLIVLPTTPDDVTHAPASFTKTIEATLPLMVSSKTLTVRGRLLSALGDPLSGMVARAFRGSSLVSNVVKTDTTVDSGAFTLMVPPDDGAAAATAQPLAVELEPATSDTPQPHFWAKPFALTTNVDLGDVHLPAFSQPNVFRFPFRGDSSDGPAVIGAIVRARTLLGDDMTGTTDFLGDGVTDANGQASLSLFPGSTAALRLYDVAVVPPPNSFYATTCLEQLPLSVGGLLPAVVLARRPVVEGTVLGSDGSPIAGVVILATRTAGEHLTACDEFASPPQVTVTTASDGTFLLCLDAGTYTLDFDPPGGSPSPRLTQTGVVVSSSGSSVVQLPAAAVVEGTLRDAAGQPLPLAGVRFYRPACAPPMTCAGAPPILEAQARADAAGHYRAVIPTGASIP